MNLNPKSDENAEHEGHQNHTGHEDHTGYQNHTGHEDHSSHQGHQDQTGHQDHTANKSDSHQNHSEHAHHDPKAFKRLFGLSLLLTLPIVIYSETVQGLFGFTPPTFPFSEFVPAILGTFLFFLGGRVFLKGGLSELRIKKPGMMALISLALIVAFGYSAFVTALHLFGIMWMGMDFWWELATLISIMLLGHWIELASIARASGAIGALAKLIPEVAELVMDGNLKQVPVQSLKVGDKVLIRPGSAIPADGEIIEGASSVDESMLTGEAKPVDKSVGDKVIAGSINGSFAKLGKGSMTVQVSAVGQNTLLAGVVRLVSEAEKSKSKTQLLADRAAGLLFYLALVSSVITLITWIAIGGYSPDFILEKVVTVLVIACPHALGLAIPLVSAITSARAASSGVIIRDRRSFEAARNVDIVLFDKTGTLTTATRAVQNITLAQASSVSSASELLALAAGLEKEAEHSLAIAIVAKAEADGVKFESATEMEFFPGLGVRGKVSGVDAMAGSAALLNSANVSVHENDKKAVDQANAAGNSVVYVVLAGKLEGYLFIGDVIRSTAQDAVTSLREMGKEVAIVSGDAEGVVASVAETLGIQKFFGELLPADKIKLVQKLQSEGRKVAFVGDGVNDAPALAQADVGLAIGAGTDVAIESAGVILVSSDPSSVAEVIKLSRSSHAKMIQNLWWAAGYNIVAIPLAAGVLFPLGLVLTPALGAVLMSLSTLIVAANAQLLRRR